MILPASSIGRLIGNVSGAAGPIVALSIPLLVVAAAAAADMGLAYVTRTTLQHTADSAALAGASALPDQDQVASRALATARANMPPSAFGTVLAGGDIRTGTWNSTTRTFVAAGEPLNAVEIVVRRADANGNPLPAILAGIFGRPSAAVAARSVATTGGDPCRSNGFLADGLLKAGNNLVVAGNACVHGQKGIQVGNNAVTSTPVELTYGSGSTFEAKGYSGVAARQTDKEIIASNEVADAIGAIQDGADAHWVIDRRPDENWSPVDCSSLGGKLYIRNVVDLSKCRSIQNLGVYGKSIQLPKHSMKNVQLASETWIVGESELEIGSNLYCDNGLDAVFMVAGVGIVLKQNVNMSGVQMIAGPGGIDIRNNKNSDIEVGVSLLSAGPIFLGNNHNIVACSQTEHVRMDRKALRLVG